MSDGADTKSATNTPDGVAWNLLQDDVAFDSISLGYDNNRSLKAVSHILGCYTFYPESLANALSVCELEPFLSTTERHAIQPPPSSQDIGRDLTTTSVTRQRTPTTPWPTLMFFLTARTTLTFTIA